MSFPYIFKSNLMLSHFHITVQLVELGNKLSSFAATQFSFGFFKLKIYPFFSAETTESELCRVFSAYGNVKSTKIIVDRAGVSKGYGFVTFDTPAVIDSLMVIT